ncbi:hypothetical protein QE152_g37918 [Popillia japonica]|uniref:Uncharacterized protein n=1 Tax=Popillia japonica TaxID=7064 RepID=A0AAW1I9G8_POPJA
MLLFEVMLKEQKFLHNGAWEAAIVKDKRKIKKGPILLQNEFILPQDSYSSPIPIAMKKFLHLQHLKKFCCIGAQKLFDNLPNNKDKPF